MLSAERMAKIVDITNQREIITVDELVGIIGVSKATVRRDITRLVENGLIRKTHGGVMSVAMGTATEPSLRMKSNLHIDEKKRIALRALNYVENNDFMILDSGTTLLEFAKLLDEKKAVTVVTYDLLVAMEVAKKPNIDLMMLGGTLRKTYYSFFGYFAEAMLSQIKAGKCFVSVDSVDVQQGLMSYTTDDIAIKKLIIESCNQVILLCDHSKFELRSFIKVCDLSRIDTIITGGEINPSVLERLREMSINVEVV